MTTIIQAKTPLSVPTSVQRRAHLKAGDEVEFKVSGGIITILPKLPTADDEYTPEQRRIIDAQLDKADEDIKAGRVYGPFDSITEMERSMRRVAKEMKGKSKPRPRR